jgi:hypothetical protein
VSGLKVTTRPGRRVYRGAPRPLAEGSCPHCTRVIQLTKRNRRREHIDPATGVRCTGSGIAVGEGTDVQLDELPPILVPDYGVGHRMDALQQHRDVVTVDGDVVRYAGGSNREAANGRAECPACERHIPLNTDGTIRRHRTIHQDPLAPYCDGAA